MAIRSVVSTTVRSTVRSTIGRFGAGGGGFSPLTNLPLDGIAPAVAISMQYLGGSGNGQSWADARHPTVRVEKGYGSGVFQDLYPNPATGELFTQPDGGGVSATAFAGSDRLLVETPYNQALAGPLASGHPSVVTDAARRMLLDISTPTNPFFAGREQGTQDASQHATERGYNTNVSVATNQGLCIMSLDRPSANNTNYNPWQNNGGTTINALVRVASNDWYPTPGVTQAFTTPAKVAHFRVAFHDSPASSSTNDTVFSYNWGNPTSNAASGALVGTSTPIRWGGPTNSVTGHCYAFVLVAGTYLTHAVNRFPQLPQKFAGICKNGWSAAEHCVAYPQANQVYPMDNFGAGTATMRIVVVSGPGRAIEANWNGAGYVAIGTTDANGYLVGSLPNAAKGAGTLQVRVVGQATVTSISNVRVGVLIARMGQSNADGRGDNITLSATRSTALNAWSNSSATQKSWIWALAQSLATTHSCPVGMSGFTAGASWLARASGATTGHWHPQHDGTSQSSHFNTAMANLIVCSEKPNYIIWHQGEEDANDGVSANQYETAIGLFIDELRSRTGWNDAQMYVMQIGRNNPVSDANTDAVRAGQIQAWNNNGSKILAGGCLAHLACGDGAADEVHFWTQSQKDAVVAVWIRHALGAGRGPRFSSMIASGTTITIQTTGGVSPLTVSGGEAASPIGWTVTDGGGSKTVTAVSVSGLQITLTVNSTLSGTVTVKWLSGDNGIGTTLLDSDATTPVPPEPFSQSVAAL